MRAGRILAALAALLLCQAVYAADIVRMSVFQSTVAAVSSVGSSKGYFAEQGIDLQPLWTTRGNETIQALATGQADVGIASAVPTIAARAKGLPIVIIGLHSHGFPGSLVAANKHANLKRLEDFKGKRIGMPVGSGVHTVFLMALERAKLDHAEFNIQNARVTDLPAAMQSGGFDAVLGWMPYSDRVVAMGNGKVVITPTQFEEMAGITYPMVVITTEEVIKKKPEALQRFMNAWVRSEAFVDKEHAETIKILRQVLGDRIKSLNDETVTQMLYSYKHDRVVLNEADLADIRNTSEFLLARKNIERKPDPSAMINQSFARKAAAK